MVAGYISGEKVYVEDFLGLSAKDFKYGEAQIVKHSALIDALNSVFRDIDGNDEALKKEAGRTLRNVIFNLNIWDTYRVPVEIKKIDALKFDSRRKAKEAQRSKLHEEIKVNPDLCGRPKVIHGGLYQPSGAILGRLVSDDFKAWHRQQKAKQDRPENT